MSDPVVIVDLFCGAGGFSTGAALAVEDQDLVPGEDVELHAINHWGTAIDTHEQNHPWAEHYHSKIEHVEPKTIADPGEVNLLVGGPECTHHSNARGGKPVDDQKREPAWNVLTWIQKLRPANVLIENVKEFCKWGPIDEDGSPSKDGSVFDAWVTALNAMGYAVDHRVLTCANYGDPTTRERLFVVARRDAQPSYPAPTHSDARDDGLDDWRSAAAIIDWSDPGTSIWTRDLELPRVQPLAQNTMARIAEGIRRHCDDRLGPFADAIERVDPDTLASLREHVVPARYAPLVADALDEPFLVRTAGRTQLHTPYLTKYYGTNYATPVDAPLDTVTAGGNKYGVSTPTSYCLRQQSGGVPASVAAPLPTVAGGGAIGLATVDGQPLIQPKNGWCRGNFSNVPYPTDRPVHGLTADPRAKLATPSLVRYSHGGATIGVDAPMPTIATEKGGVFALTNPYLVRYFGERSGQNPRTRPLDVPAPTVTATGSHPGLARPYLVEYYGASDVADVRQPLPTATAKDRFALCVPEVGGWGLDIRYRMLAPDELKQAQGFPAGYELAGDTKEDLTEQIGNAVPVNTAKALCTHLLGDESFSWGDHGGGLADSGTEIPEYGEVAADD